MKESFKKRYNLKWVFIISVATFFMSAIFTIISDRLVEVLSTSLSFLVLIIIIGIGIVFDIIGIAVTTGGEQVFHAMAANKVKEARHAIKLVRNAAQVSNFCNDVIGDICGIISGAISTNIVFNVLKSRQNLNGAVLSIAVTALVASLTVGGKALGKNIAINFNDDIIFIISKILYQFEDKLNIKIFREKREGQDKDTNKRKRKKEG